MREIPITQFLRPDGEIRNLVCDVSYDVADIYEEVIRPLGVRVTAECIQHSHFVNLCLEEPMIGDQVIRTHVNLETIARELTCFRENFALGRVRENLCIGFARSFGVPEKFIPFGKVIDENQYSHLGVSNECLAG
jgi:hypothetical protein